MFFSRLHKRISERVKPLHQEPVEVQIMDSDSIDILKAFDISVKGIGVRTPDYFDSKIASREVELVISLPKSRSFMARGIIRHVTVDSKKSPCFGVEFTDIAKSNIDKIENYMRQVTGGASMAG